MHQTDVRGSNSSVKTLISYAKVSWHEFCNLLLAAGAMETPAAIWLKQIIKLIGQLMYEFKSKDKNSNDHSAVYGASHIERIMRSIAVAASLIALGIALGFC